MPDLGRILEDSGSIMHGHFVLTSGRHSDVYFEKFRILDQPEVLSALCAELVAKVGTDFDFIAGPTTGGIIIAFEIARQMRKPAVYVETENGRKTLRRGKTIPNGARVLVVDDVLTTGTSLVETKQAIEEAGGVVKAFAVLIDRSSGLELDVISAYKVEAETYADCDVPEWLARIPAVKPGTRTV